MQNWRHWFPLAGWDAHRQLAVNGGEGGADSEMVGVVPSRRLEVYVSSYYTWANQSRDQQTWLLREASYILLTSPDLGIFLLEGNK